MNSPRMLEIELTPELIEKLPDYLLLGLYGRLKTKLLIRGACINTPAPKPFLDLASKLSLEISKRQLDQGTQNATAS